MSGRDINEAWAAWLHRQMRLRNFPTPTSLARAAGVDQSVVSRWLNEGRTPQIELLRKIAAPLDVTMLDLLAAAGYVTREEVDVGTSAPAVADVPDAIVGDVYLLEEAKAHLLNQYELLLRVAPATPHPRRAGTVPFGYVEGARKRMAEMHSQVRQNGGDRKGDAESSDTGT